MTTKRKGGGYCKPPEALATRWKPGESGNPKGRPKKKSQRASLARAALDRKISVTERGVRKFMTVEEVGLRNLADKAAAGNLKALDYLRTLSLQEGEDPANEQLSQEDERIIREALERLVKKGKSNG